MKTKRLKRAQRGVSLIEVVMTAFVIVVGLLVVMSSFVAIAKSQRYSERMDLANALLRMEMERVRNQDYDDVVAIEGEYFIDFPDQPEYRKQIGVTENDNVKTVEVGIYFENDRRRVVATTMLANLD
jgi:Tfp pilus assembly protein PilV